MLWRFCACPFTASRLAEEAARGPIWGAENRVAIDSRISPKEEIPEI
jgi:hypothetical protein